MIVPPLPRSAIALPKTWQARKTDVRFVLRMRCHSSSSISKNGVELFTPAALPAYSLRYPYGQQLTINSPDARFPHDAEALDLETGDSRPSYTEPPPQCSKLNPWAFRIFWATRLRSPGFARASARIVFRNR